MAIWLCLIVLLMAAAAATKPAAGRGTPLLAQTDGDDSDMKIAGPVYKQQLPGTEEEEKELRLQQANGNLPKARVLGEALARQILEADGDRFFGFDPAEGEEMRMQRRLLLAFVVNYAVERGFEGKLLSRVALNAFYDTLKADDPAFYADIGESGSFSFYYLCMRRGDCVPRCVGRSFAMLTGNEGVHAAAELGEALFLHFNDVIEKEIHAAGFAL